MACCEDLYYSANRLQSDRILTAINETSFRCQPWPWWRWVLIFLNMLALTLSVYLIWHYLVGGPVIGCGGGSPCDRALNSRWSSVGGVLPVSGLASGVYLAMLVASLFIGPATEPPVRRLAWSAMLIFGGAATGGAVWFTIVQKWFIGAFCPYCMATHITGLLLGALVIWRAPMQFDGDSTDVALTNPALAPDGGIAAPTALDATKAEVIGRFPTIGLALVGVALAGIMAASQAAFTPKAVYRGGESRENLPTIDPHVAPMIGSPDSAYVVNVLFDYKCPHCQQLHLMLDEAVRRYGGKLAFALCPTPLNTNCNPYIPRNVDEFADSCELAKVSLAVWVARREAFPAFGQWMFSFESGDRWKPRTLDAARAKAVELVGQAKLDTAWANPWIARYMQASIRIYGQTVQNGNTAVPKLVFGSRWVIPEPNDADDLILILHDSLAVPSP